VEQTAGGEVAETAPTETLEPPVNREFQVVHHPRLFGL